MKLFNVSQPRLIETESTYLQDTRGWHGQLWRVAANVQLFFDGNGDVRLDLIITAICMS